MNDSGVFLFLTTMQILYEKVQNGSDSYSFLERLLDISNENSKFTPDDVIAETATILTGVGFFLSINLYFMCGGFQMNVLLLRLAGN